ncbi:hypothetical protein HYV12_01810 [Candidatus Dojkabacteria bacterium]|nr:hypothetical protein [Candidatus Dojkabacteria bacterium]
MNQISQKNIVVILAVTVVLLVVATILLNPGRRLADERNRIRIENMGQIVAGVTEYAKKNDGVLPKGIPVSDNCADTKYEICRASSKNCGERVALKVLVNDKYMDFMPVDPTQDNPDGTGYHVVQSEKGRLTVCAPQAELGRTLEYIK